MPCFSPREGFRAIGGGWTSNPKTAYVDQPLSVPCGGCIGCRADRAKSWAVRCVHELQMHERSCFITLTYSPENIPPGSTLVKRHVQLFLKRLRKLAADNRISYFGCGEYGSNFDRPHYHIILFGIDFDDKKRFKAGTGGKGTLYTSETLERLWPYGFSTVGAATYESAAYTARYCLKKITGQAAQNHYGDRQPEFIVCSTKPAIGARWFAKYHPEVTGTDSIIAQGREAPVPRYYDKLLKRKDETTLKRNKHERRIDACEPKRVWNNSPSRLAVRREVAESKARIYQQRDFEK